MRSRPQVEQHVGIGAIVTEFRIGGTVGKRLPTAGFLAAMGAGHVHLAKFRRTGKLRFLPVDAKRVHQRQHLVRGVWPLADQIAQFLRRQRAILGKQLDRFVVEAREKLRLADRLHRRRIPALQFLREVFAIISRIVHCKLLSIS